MNKNIQQFSVYSADIFNELYDAFPMMSALRSEDMIRPYLDIAIDEDMKELQNTVDMGELVSIVSGLTDAQKLNIDKAKDKIYSIKRSKQQDSNKQRDLFEGTLLFLRDEYLLRETDDHDYQLTAKGFSHLNKIFTNNQISNSKETYIAAIKSVLSNTGSIVSGVAVNVITDMLKNS